MFSTPTASGVNSDTGASAMRVNIPGRPDDYYGGDFVEDGSFLVLSTDALSLSPTTPPGGDGDMSDEDTKNMDIEVLNSVDEDETNSSSTCHSNTQAQVLGEDPESSVDSISKMEEQKSESLNVGIRDPATSSVTNISLASASSSSTDAHLIESNEEVNLLMAENKKLAELLADSNEKMKQCITTTEKLKTDHEEYKKKHEASRDVISQLRQDNEVLKSQMSATQTTNDNAGSFQTELQRQSNEILELTEQLKTVLSVNGKLNDDLRECHASNEEFRAELDRLRAEKNESESKFDVLKAEIDTGRQTIAKFHEHRMRNEAELAKMRSELIAAVEKLQRMEAVVEEKTKLTGSLRRNMEDTVTALERCNLKLNQKEEEVSLLTTKIAAINAESDNSERLEVLQMQCQTYLADFEKEREEREKLAVEKEELLKQLNLTNQELKQRSDALDAYRHQYGNTEQQQQHHHQQAESASRNDNAAADNSNESLSSPLTSLPSVAGQFASFVRRELLVGKEDLGASLDTNQHTEGGAAETVVQQPTGIPPCPICRKTFSSLETLQTHASNCGDLDPFGGHPEDNSFVFP
ncbi:Nucleoprotein TPR [Orchesella cincta]|uniref:Nucleoprotein TPR n=1 Tax=Orchesella cincta TaxID=48709 RepID=A0A1D2NIA1_ORCCI|nr:Nucleoprotein TPR [Orchesella cincta]